MKYLIHNNNYAIYCYPIPNNIDAYKILKIWDKFHNYIQCYYVSNDITSLNINKICDFNTITNGFLNINYLINSPLIIHIEDDLLEGLLPYWGENISSNRTKFIEAKKTMLLKSII